MRRRRKKKIRLFEKENKNIDKYKFKIKVLMVLSFSVAGGLQKTPEESLSWRSPTMIGTKSDDIWMTYTWKGASIYFSILTIYCIVQFIYNSNQSREKHPIELLGNNTKAQRKRISGPLYSLGRKTMGLQNAAL